MGYDYKMTICIAALYDDKKKGILVADKQITFKDASGKIQLISERDDTKKIIRLNDRTYIMMSGRGSIIDKFRRLAQQRIKANQGYKATLRILNRVYEDVRRDEAFVNVVGYGGYGGTYFNGPDHFYKKVKEDIDAVGLDTVLQWSDKMRRYRIGGDDFGIIVVTKNKNVYELFYGNEKELVHKENGYALEGSGWIEAQKSLEDKYALDLTEAQVKDVVIRAKQAAENDDMVGKKTDIVYLK